MKKYLNVFFRAILAGMMISIGAGVYLSMYNVNKILGSFLFAFGLFTIINFEFHLFTGKVGELLNNKAKYIVELLVSLFGNIIGGIAFSLLFSLSRHNEILKANAETLVNIKQNDSWYSILVLSIFCGIMIYFAVKGHKKCEYGIAKFAFCFLAVAIFILSGFEHCIANVCYYAYAGVFDLKVVLYVLIMVIGNSIGAVLCDVIIKLAQRFTDNK